MLTYPELYELDAVLQDTHAGAFFFKGNDLFAIGIEQPIARDVHPSYRMFFSAVDPELVGEFVRYALHLKRKYTYKRRK